MHAEKYWRGKELPQAAAAAARAGVAAAGAAARCVGGTAGPCAGGASGREFSRGTPLAS